MSPILITIAKDVLLIRFFSTDPKIVNSVFSLTTSNTGKSSLGRVEMDYFPEPDSTDSLSPFKKIEISDPSGKSLQSSLSFFAGAVVEPVLSTLVGVHVV